MNHVNPFSIILILNSFFLIGLILTQNENTKDSTNQNNYRTTPIQIFIFGSIIIQLLIFLISSKITDF
jgi:preprotein translocase subunit SecG